MKIIKISLAITLILLCPSLAKDPQERGDFSISLLIQERVNDEGTKVPVSKDQADQALRALQSRLNYIGIREAHLSREGSDRIFVKLKGVSTNDANRIGTTLGRRAKLELRNVSERSEELAANGKTLAQLVHDGSEIIPGFRAYLTMTKDEDGNIYESPVLLSRRVGLSEEDIASIVPAPHIVDAVAITLNANGTDKMIELTKNLQPGRDRIAILIDDKVISAPVVNQVPLGKNFIIEGLSRPGEAQELANLLTNRLEFDLKVDQVQKISQPKE
jgi:SecD/SecF fusion protein